MTTAPERPVTKPVRPTALPMSDSEAIGHVVTRGAGYAYVGAERGMRRVTPVLVDRIEVLLRERLNVTPKQWARLEPLIREEIQRATPAVAATAASAVRTRLALDASVSLSPRMKGSQQ